MFGRSNKVDELRKMPSKSSPAAHIETWNGRDQGTRDRSYFGRTAQFKGDLTLDENLHIEGTVDGVIRVPGKKLVIGKKALITAQIHAGTVEVQGKVEGDLHGSELVQLCSTAVVNGTIHCKRIVIEDGARFNGKIEMIKEEPEAQASDGKTTVTKISKDIASIS